MGIPKFFTYISERYPCLCEMIKDYQIPEFDNFYLDMNGIIHVCSHLAVSDMSHPISEETMFKDMFHYIEMLFRMILPQKLLVVAIDGVAPRAKMNHQRSRRFRVAEEIQIHSKAKGEGIEMATELRFDSNCITPGTLFMSKLDEQIKHFIAHKISTDKLWQKCKVIFSGSKVPGEGEHKIMEYIRYMKAQPDYDPNTRHCLYGLDSDLIILGLCTHEIHFTLLREEIKFGSKQRHRITTVAETNFCLFHLTLLRDYIDREFSLLKEKLSFPYDIDKIIDDWILMGFLVGNDFIPNLPNLHISHNALPLLYQVYMDVLPTLDGYINETGTLKLDRFEKFMEKLSRFDIRQFSERYEVIKYIKSKMGKCLSESERHSYKNSEDNEEIPSPKKVQDTEFDALLRSTAAMSVGTFDEDEAGDDESDSDMFNMKFVQHKRDYYINKLKYENIDEDVLRSQAECYIRAIQWNLNYYYNGCCSWSWYYPHHYAPYVSDIKGFKDLKLEFELGEPFLPFEQLLAVLPPRSNDLLPTAFQTLQTDKESPIISYYPLEYETDLNGKKQEWEAVALIPFIPEKDLLDAMAPYYEKLTPEEQKRNAFGPMFVFSFTKENVSNYTAPECFPDIIKHVNVQLINNEDIIVPRERLVRGLCPGIKLDVFCPGFPTLQYIQHTASLEKAKVKALNRISSLDSMILHITPQSVSDLRSVASEMLGKTVFVNWPYLTEAQVVSVSNCDTKLSLNHSLSQNSCEKIKEETLKDTHVVQWNMQKKHITEMYKSRLGIEIGETSILIHARPLVGSKYIFGKSEKLHLKEQWSNLQIAYPCHMIVKDITVHYINRMFHETIHDVFVPNTICFKLGHPHFGAMGKILDPAVCPKSGRIRVSVNVMPEPSLEAIGQAQAGTKTEYLHRRIAAQMLGISSHLLSRITGAIYVKQSSDEFQQDDTTYNVGLNLKFNKRNEEILGYTRKINGLWSYSTKAIVLTRNYMVQCPELFERLAQNIYKDVFLEEDLFNKGTGELSKTVSWISEQLQGTEIRPCGMETLDASTVKKIQEEVDEFFKVKNNTCKFLTLQVKPHLLFLPDLHLSKSPPDPKAETHLLDRVCCVKDNFTVPLGYKGTVIEIQKAENSMYSVYGVLFDKPFPAGLAICGSSECRVYRLTVFDFINITYGERTERGKVATAEVNAESVGSWRLVSGQKVQSRVDRSCFASGKSTNYTNYLSSDPPALPGDGTERGKAATVEVNAKPGDSWKLAANQKAQPRADPSSFASYRSTNYLPTNSPVLPKPPVYRNAEDAGESFYLGPPSKSYKWKGYDSQDDTQSAYEPPKDVQQVAPCQNRQNTQNKEPTTKPASEFQALWNELHKKQKSDKPPETRTEVRMPPKMKEIKKAVPENTPQDPSALLKAMLKISDEDTQVNVQPVAPKPRPSNIVPQKEDKVLDTPPLVQQLFDHARQNEKVKDERTPIWYCSQLLNYYQLSRVGLPRYNYFTDGETNLIRAHILLPDKRIFVGDPCGNHELAAGSAAKKVYTELKSVKVLPNMKTFLPPPQHWFSNRQNNSWTSNIRPPVAPFYHPVPQPAQLFPHWPATVVQYNQGYQRKPKQNSQHISYSQSKPACNEPKSEIKDSTSFVPLQAQKKSRNIIAKQSIKEANPCAEDNLQTTVQKKKNELPTKTTKVEAVTVTSEKQKSAQSSSCQVQKTQNVTKPKTSRVAAKFGIPSLTEEHNSKNST